MSSVVAMTKLGTAMPSVAMNMIVRSIQRLRLNAAIVPMGTPINIARPMAMRPSLAETGNFSPMI